MVESGRYFHSVFVHLRVDGTAIIEDLEQVRFGLSHDALDRSDMPIDNGFLDLLFTAAEDPDVGLGNFSRGVRAGPGATEAAAETDGPLDYLESDQRETRSLAQHSWQTRRLTCSTIKLEEVSS